MKSVGMVVHDSEYGECARGSLLANYTGELLPGDCIQLQSGDEMLRQFGLTLTVGRALAPEADGTSTEFVFDCAGYIAHLHLQQLRMVQRWSQDLRGWPPGERTLVTYACGLNPSSYVRFTVVLSVDFVPRFERHILACRPGTPVQAQEPKTLGPTAKIEWWACLVEQAPANPIGPRIAL